MGSIEPMGFALCFSAFIGKGSAELYNELLMKLPEHISFLDLKEITQIITAINQLNLQADQVFANYIYPKISEKKSISTIKDLNLLISELKKRHDFSENLHDELQQEIKEKLSNQNSVSFGGKSLAK